jgi:hypothetical protein
MITELVVRELEPLTQENFGGGRDACDSSTFVSRRDGLDTSVILQRAERLANTGVIIKVVGDVDALRSVGYSYLPDTHSMTHQLAHSASLSSPSIKSPLSPSYLSSPGRISSSTCSTPQSSSASAFTPTSTPFSGDRSSATKGKGVNGDSRDKNSGAKSREIGDELFDKLKRVLGQSMGVVEISKISFENNFLFLENCP